MSEPKSFSDAIASYVEQQILEAQKNGAFDNLRGKGKPIEDLDEPVDEMWWWRKYFEREGLSLLPEALQVVRDAERIDGTLDAMGSETDVRAEVEELNRRIRNLLRYGSDGPDVRVSPLDVAEQLKRWRARRRR